MNKINYDKHDWVDREPITQTLFNNIEGGIGRATSSTNLLVDRTNQEEESLSTIEGKIEHQDMEFDIAIDGHDTLDERLKADVSRFVEVWSGGNYMPFEGKNIRIDNSKVGWIRDFSMEGETYQDPNNLSDIQSAGDLVDGRYEIEVLSHNKNLLNYPLIGGDINPSTGEVINNGMHAISGNFTEVLPNKTVTLSYTPIVQPQWFAIYYYDKDKNYISMNDSSLTFVTPTNCRYIRFKIENFENVNINDCQLEYSSTKTSYVSHKEDKTQILLDEPLMKLPDGTYDTIEQREDGVYLVQRIGKRILNGSEGWGHNEFTPNQNNTLCFNSANAVPFGSAFISDKFSFLNTSDFDNSDFECITSGTSALYALMIRINKNVLNQQDVNGLKTWLQANPTTVYYELAEPIETKLDLDMSKWLTYQDVTYFTTTCNVQPILSLKAPVDINAVVSELQTANYSLRRNNQQLEQENQQAEKELNTLQEQHDQQTADLLDMDMRVLMLEE